MCDEDRRERQSLPLPTGKRMNAARLQARQPRFFKRKCHFPRHFLRCLPAIFQREPHFIRDRHRKELIIRRLVHRADREPDILRRHRKEVAPVQKNLSRCFRAVSQKPRDGLDERRFPAAALPGQEHHVPFGKRKRERRKRFLFPRPIPTRKIFDFQHHWLITPDNFFPSFMPRNAPRLL